MVSPQDSVNQSKILDNKTTIIATALTFLLVIIGFSISLATGSVGLFILVFTGVGIGIISLLLLSFGIIIIRGGLATTNIKIVGLFVLSAAALLFLLSDITTLRLESIFLFVFIIGLVFPQLLIQYTRLGSIE